MAEVRSAPGPNRLHVAPGAPGSGRTLAASTNVDNVERIDV